jgi:hypothetical protein
VILRFRSRFGFSLSLTGKSMVLNCVTELPLAFVMD